jgi:hypothetical protein
MTTKQFNIWKKELFNQEYKNDFHIFSANLALYNKI